MKKSKINYNDFSQLRKKAEERLKDSAPSAKQLSHEEAARLIHELSVHQVELEMQNEELRNTQLDLSKSRQRYADLFDGAPVGYFILNRKGQILELNSAGAELLEVEKEKTAGKPFLVFVAAAYYDTFFGHLEKTLKSKGIQYCEIELVRGSGAILYAGLQSEAVKDANGTFFHFRTAVLDLTQRRTITALQQSQEKLRKAHDDLYNVLESITDGFFSLDRSWRFTYVNAEAEKLLTKNRQELLGNDIWEMFAEAKGSGFEREYERAIAQNTAVHFEEYYPPFKCWYEVHAYPYAAGLSVYFRNVTERKQAEETLRKYELLARHTRDMILFIRRRNGHIIEGNEAAVNAYGYDRGELLSQSIYDLRGDKNIKLIESQMDTADASGIVFETIHRRKDGSVFPVEVSSQGITVGEDRVLLSIIRDISERKLTEDTLRFLLQCGDPASGEDFFQSLARYLAKSLSMDFVCIDRLQEGSFAAETVAVYFDGKFEDNVSYTLKDTPCGDVVGKTICCFDKDVRRLFPKDVVLQEMAAESYVGTTLWSSQGQPIGLIAVIGRKALTDTKLAASILQLVAVRAAGELERRRALDELKRLSNELEYKNEELESIIRIASHDLRSPLMNIKGFSGELSKEIGKVEEMLKEVTLPEKASQKIETVFTKYVPEAIGFIQGSADAINQMLASLTQVVRAGTVPLRMRDLDMNAILATITANVQFKLRETVAELTVEPLPGCRGDADQIAQVFTNLIENAIKYREPSRPLRIQVYASAEPGKVTYCVEDNGKGIAEEHRNTVFDLFARLDPEATKGEGLGLTIAKRMVERQGGKIWVSSEPGKGAKFFVTLPK